MSLRTFTNDTFTGGDSGGGGGSSPTSALGTGAVPALLEGVRLRQFGAAETNSNLNVNTSNGSARFYLIPIMGGGSSVTLNSLGFYLATTATGNCTIALSIYDAADDGFPGLLKFGSSIYVPSSTTASAQEIAMSTPLDEGWYWVSMGVSGNVLSLAGHNDDIIMDGVMGTPNASNTRFVNILNTTLSAVSSGSFSGGTGVWDADITGVLGTGNMVKTDTWNIYVGRS